jgi:serine/threonine protein kinase
MAAASTNSFACPACGAPVRAGTELAGKEIECPNCKKAVRVPTMFSEPPQLAPSTEELATAATVPPDQAPTGTYQPDGNAWELSQFLHPPLAPDELGRLGPYRVLQVLGAGGMGIVFHAEDPQLKRSVALKAMLPTLGGNESARKRFLREAQAAAAISHDNVVHIYQVGEDHGVPFMAMQFLEGEPLDSRLNREGLLSPAEAVRIGRETAEGLAAAHQRGLIHRDIKPANLWLERPGGRVKILDFGVARATSDSAQLTQTGAIVGTPAYMAPEQARAKSIDHRRDAVPGERSPCHSLGSGARYSATARIVEPGGIHRALRFCHATSGQEAGRPSGVSPIRSRNSWGA